jgi:protein TonB
MTPQSQIPSGDEQWDSDAITIPIALATLSQPAASLVVLSQDPMLLEAIATAAAGVATVTVWPSAVHIVEQLAAIRAEVLMIDPAYASPGLPTLLDSLHRQFPALQLMLVGPGNVQHQLQTQLTDGTVFRFIHKPASAQRLKLLVNAALRERQKYSQAALASAPAGKAKLPTPRRAFTQDGARSPITANKWLGAALAAVVLLAIAGTLIWHSSASIRAVAPPPIAAKPAAPPAPMTAVPSEEPPPATIDGAAAVPIEKSTPAAQKESPKLAGAERRAPSEARARQIDELVQLAQSRIASGALIEPSEDSARTYLNSAAQLAPRDQRVRALSLALGEAMLAEFRKEMAAGDLSAAERWLKASAGYPIAGMTPTQMSAQLDAAKGVQRTHTAAVSSEGESIPAVREASSVAAAASGDQIIPEGDLRRLRFTAPNYPEEALERRQSGSVDMDFTLTPQGTVSDIKVTQSSPSGVFDRAAITALSRNRYQPVERNGVPVPQRVHVRMRFAL